MIKRNYMLMANYNKKSNALMNAVINTISDEEWNRKFNGFFTSIHELCSHIYICDFNWLKRFKQLRNFNVLNNEMFEKNYTFTETIFTDITEYSTMRTKLDEIIMEFINELENNDFDSILKFTDSRGNKIERKMDSLIMHTFNHEIHHRGMISLYLDMLGKENDYSGSLYKMDLL